ncbi:MAG: hypothetical protein WDW38_011069 [Sanguina aurantia]
MLASHGRLMWYDTITGNVTVLHDGHGVHYGVFPGEFDAQGGLKSVWNVLRPHNWHPKSSEEHLLHLDVTSGTELSRVVIPSRFTHDAVRRGDTVFLCNTEEGAVMQLSYPSMQVVHSSVLFTFKQHVNTLAPLEDNELWAVLHNLGQSDIVKLDMATNPPTEVARLKHVGNKAHGLVLWHQLFVVLDSAMGRLVTVDPYSDGRVVVIWQCPSQQVFLKGLVVVDDVAYFGVSRSLARSKRADPEADSELAAVDLGLGALLWRRQVPTRGLLNIVAAPHLGESSSYRALYVHKEDDTADCTLAAHLAGKGCGGGSGSTSSSTEPDVRLDDVSADKEVAGDTRGHGSGGAAGTFGSKRLRAGNASSVPAATPATQLGRAGAGIQDGMRGSDTGTGQQEQHHRRQQAADQADQVKSSQARGRETLANDLSVVQTTALLASLGFEPQVSGHWHSGLPRLDLAVKDSPEAWKAGIQLPLVQLDVSALKAKVLAMPPAMWEPSEQRETNAVVEGRKDNMDKYKPGAKAMFLVFSDQSTRNVYRYPYYEYFAAELDALLEQVVGREDMGKVVRMQLALIQPGGVIKIHKDMGGYAKKAHRIHVPIVTDTAVAFEVCALLERDSHGRIGNQVVPEGSKQCTRLTMAEGMVFEVNNRVLHRVYNRSPIGRVQLVIDIAESPRVPKKLKAGTRCNYVQAVIVCPNEQ